MEAVWQWGESGRTPTEKKGIKELTTEWDQLCKLRREEEEERQKVITVCASAIPQSWTVAFLSQKKRVPNTQFRPISDLSVENKVFVKADYLYDAESEHQYIHPNPRLFRLSGTRINDQLGDPRAQTEEIQPNSCLIRSHEFYSTGSIPHNFIQLEFDHY